MIAEYIATGLYYAIQCFVFYKITKPSKSFKAVKRVMG